MTIVPNPLYVDIELSSEVLSLYSVPYAASRGAWSVMSDVSFEETMMSLCQLVFNRLGVRPTFSLRGLDCATTSPPELNAWSNRPAPP